MRFRLDLTPEDIDKVKEEEEREEKRWSLRGFNKRLPTLWDIGFAVIAGWIITEGIMVASETVASGIHRIAAKNESRRLQRLAGAKLYQELSKEEIDPAKLTALSTVYQTTKPGASTQSKGIQFQLNPSIKI